MSDVAIEAFAHELAAEVDEAVRAGDDTVYSMIEFTRIVLERLAESGAVENPAVLWQEGHFGRMRYKVNGFAMPDDDERLLPVASVYTGDLPPRTVTRTDLISACEQPCGSTNAAAGGCMRRSSHRIPTLSFVEEMGAVNATFELTRVCHFHQRGYDPFVFRLSRL